MSITVELTETSRNSPFDSYIGETPISTPPILYVDPPLQTLPPVVAPPLSERTVSCLSLSDVLRIGTMIVWGGVVFLALYLLGKLLLATLSIAAGAILFAGTGLLFLILLMKTLPPSSFVHQLARQISSIVQQTAERLLNRPTEISGEQTRPPIPTLKPEEVLRVTT